MFSFDCYSQNLLDTIVWNDSLKLKWADYQAVPDTTSAYFQYTSAASSIEILAEGYWKNDLPDFNVKAIFFKQESWTYGILTDSLLKHEQVHFDIAELFARKIRKEILMQRDANNAKMDSYVRLIQDYISLWREEESKYDSATNHGLNHVEQHKWNRIIAKELELYNKYTSSFEASLQEQN